VSTVFKALADPTRRSVLQLLRRQPMTAGEIAGHFKVSKPTMSAHFAILREAELIDGEKVGKTIVYRLKLSVLEDAMLSFAQAMGLGVAPEAPIHGKQGEVQ
jgi:DNA-binding transcriptional ArsR family regulator